MNPTDTPGVLALARHSREMRRDRIAEINREIAQIEAASASRIEMLRKELRAIDALVGAQETRPI